MISRKDIDNLLRYEHETGQFYWRVANSNRVKVGTLAGTVNSNGHVVIGINSRIYLAHRLAWLLTYDEWPPDEIDHKNGIPGDNRVENLRIAKHAENMRNRRKHSNNTSGFKGVNWSSEKGKWRARLHLNSKAIHLGYFSTAEDAYAAYRIAAEKHHGEFARFA